MSTGAVGAAQERHHLTEHMKTLRNSLGGPFRSLPPKTSVSVLMKHGGFQILTKSGAVLTRLKPHLGQQMSEDTLANIATTIKAKADMFFQRLCESCYSISSELMSYLTFPHEGRSYTEPSAVEAENPTIPAAFTFVGQFIDHDLTFNGANLFDDQSGPQVPNFASPLIDLDSVYGGRSYPNDPSDASTKGIIKNKDVFHPDMTFRLVKLGPNAYDLNRWSDASEPGRLGAAYIFDPRNDENQIILQIHILLMRVHNRLLRHAYQNGQFDPKDSAAVDKAAGVVKAEVVASWQSMLLNDYLPRVCDPDILKQVLEQIQLPGHGNLKYKPAADGVLQMPHEFAIAFRFGHSMLRSAYRLNNFDPIPLFNNRDIARRGDLRGGRPLSKGHVIDWDVFFPKDEFGASLSLKIDGKVTPVVFDLPESAVPDAIKTNGNLPYRNLARSREIDLACGEDLAAFFGIDVSKRLTPFQVEPDDQAHYFFRSDGNVYEKPGGVGKPLQDLGQKGFKDSRFKTPLWYYILKEAEVFENGERLGPLGSRLVAEVICGGMFYGDDFKFDFEWKSKITGTNVVKFRDLIDFVDEEAPVPV